MGPTLRWGVIGTGGIAATFAQDLALSGAGVVTAVGSRSAETARRFAERFSVAHAHESYEALVADDTVDCVYVATPHPLHYDNARLALEQGRPVLVEKAFTMTASEARDLVGIARDRGLFLMEAMWTRFLPHVRALREIVEGGALGEVVAVYADHGQWFELDPASRLFDPALGGGALLDLGVYPVSFASMLLGPPARIAAVVDDAFTGVDGQASMAFSYGSGAQSLLTCTSRAQTATRASIVGTDARIEVEGDFYAPTSFTLVPRSGESTTYHFETAGRGLHYEASEVARCLDAGELESPQMPLNETIEIMATMEEVLSVGRATSTTTGR
ncbi:MAG TPA: Gfo/Idh/MocA family oxidoreductase [Acidimicrobiales bacterium]|nr:Gfo/Idh/MocA family oxidoreductase [Acidimicrobiales bacterium]